MRRSSQAADHCSVTMNNHEQGETKRGHNEERRGAQKGTHHWKRPRRKDSHGNRKCELDRPDRTCCHPNTTRCPATAVHRCEKGRAQGLSHLRAGSVQRSLAQGWTAETDGSLCRWCPTHNIRSRARKVRAHKHDARNTQSHQLTSCPALLYPQQNN